MDNLSVRVEFHKVHNQLHNQSELTSNNHLLIVNQAQKEKKKKVRGRAQ